MNNKISNIRNTKYKACHFESSVRPTYHEFKNDRKMKESKQHEEPETISLKLNNNSLYYINCSVLQGFLPPRNVVSEHT